MTRGDLAAKRCSGPCRRVLERSTAHFARNRATHDGFQKMCKECDSDRLMRRHWRLQLARDGGRDRLLGLLRLRRDSVTMLEELLGIAPDAPAEDPTPDPAAALMERLAQGQPDPFRTPSAKPEA